MRVINQNRNSHQVSSLVYWIGLTEATRVATPDEETLVCLKGTKVQDMEFRARWAIR